MGLQLALATRNFWHKISIRPVIIKSDQYTRNYSRLGEKRICVILENAKE